MHKKTFGLRSARRDLKKKTIYLLPNLLTTSALFCGFFAIVRSMNGDFRSAAFAIFFSTIFDNLDGRVARLTHTQSAFGAEYDSLSDMICFGAAPALIMYEWSLKAMGRSGWAAAFIYCVTAALRLARFNVSLDEEEGTKPHFLGLPSPVAAILLVSYVTVVRSHTPHVSPFLLDITSWVLTVFAGLMMISSIPFYSGKNINFRKSIPFSRVVWVVLAIVALSQSLIDLFDMLFFLSLSYLFWGCFRAVFNRLLRKKNLSSPEDDSDSGCTV
ncbi:CDP-diacylglycerol--serine O-phosphatidyltransferase [Candidatus Ichthyocystis hellenicum]|uniref:CDP-diacylglycerol--serine O-phosphatidyltransferase n=1 Tax=Candidatus Ichthyocystis hellenicum TaxID=1561003 RepID=UPI000A75F247|nr:CDP-diacylglycerol--serine O-phosphatidyltransferase [Candidatus Ichthyocystis hellenicum]